MSLTAQQLEAVKEGYANIVVNCYTLEEAQQIIFDHLCEEFEELNEQELEHLIIDETSEDLYEQLLRDACEDDNNMNIQL
tara:strand:- start:63 stop:302 length:240 start_codon:yes stop_codon:yes gene_type:complete